MPGAERMTLATCPFCDSGLTWNNCACKYALMAQRRGLMLARQTFFADGSPRQITLKAIANEVIAGTEADDKSRTALVAAISDVVEATKRQNARKAQAGGARGGAAIPPLPDQNPGRGYIGAKRDERSSERAAPAGLDPAMGTSTANAALGVTSPGEQRAPSRKKAKANANRVIPADQPAPSVRHVGAEGSSAAAGRDRGRRGHGDAKDAVHDAGRGHDCQPDRAAPVPAATAGSGAKKRSLLAPKGQCGFCDTRRDADAARIKRHRGNKVKPA